MTVPDLIAADPVSGVFVLLFAILAPPVASALMWWVFWRYDTIIQRALHPDDRRRRPKIALTFGAFTVLLAYGAVAAWFGIGNRTLHTVLMMAVLVFANAYVIQSRRAARILRPPAPSP